ncbi:malonyl-CoA decarboxylase, mitochondrial-like [Rhizophagus clarus]|uniref:Malonyl-CoA decarboxylase, mitochondrial-like n=1 Tax=Rhizophagus clarus TaxID=94130 RepID=A0A8H3L7B6_9GLOM|nr:malonyl-CoA decarboxylase, mitochondrial-like [Rhizophagus clarus]
MLRSAVVTCNITLYRHNRRSTIIHNIMKQNRHNRKFSSFNHDLPQKSVSNNEAQNLFEQYIQQSLETDAIEDFWQNIEAYTHEPGFFSFGGPNSKLAINEPRFIRKLISVSVSEKRNEGDLVPTLMTKKCCELYENLDKEDRIKFLKILAHDFGVMRDKVFRATDHYIGLSNADANERAILRAEQILRHAMIPVHHIFFDRINRLPNGTKFLMDIRSDLLENYHHCWWILTLKRLTWHSPAAPWRERVGPVNIPGTNDSSRSFIENLGHEPLNFSTLSPIPGLSKWLINAINVEGDSILNKEEIEKVKSLRKELDGSGTEILKHLIKSKDWIRDEKCFHELKPILMRLCARYILTEKRRNLALDPVANFHIRNGACVYRLNWLGDISKKGLDESFGIMVNYNYILDHIENNNRQYLCDGSITISNVDPVLVDEAKRTTNIKII